MIKDELHLVIRQMSRLYGKDISAYDESFIIKTMEKRWKATETKNCLEYLVYLSKNRNEGEEFFAALNNTYSEFFRNPLVFALLEQIIIPRIIEEKPKGKEIRVWSAGCSAGQEAYSIAILLDHQRKLARKRINFRVFATDISHGALAAAKDGIYDSGAVQNVKLKHLQEYFIKSGENYRICNRLKECICFSLYDLLDKESANPWESIYGDFDLVFCSNLLFYYRGEFRRFILDKVVKATAANGYLITGETERAFVEKSGGLTGVAPPAPVFQRKKYGGVQ